MKFNKIWFKEHRVIASKILILNAVVQLLWNGYGVYTGIGIARAAFNFVGEYFIAITLIWVAYGFTLAPNSSTTKS